MKNGQSSGTSGFGFQLEAIQVKLVKKGGKAPGTTNDAFRDGLKKYVDDQEEWAFVSDVVRLYALVTEGGIYMDTDIEVVKPLDELLTLEAFMGFEIETKISTGIIGAVPHHPFMEEWYPIIGSH